MSYYVYAFEAKEIQEYILERTRLAEMMGASAIIDALCAETLDSLFSALGYEEMRDFRMARRGGGGFTLVFTEEEKAKKLRDLVSLVIPQFAPDLRFVHAIGADDELDQAIKQALGKLPIAHQHPPVPLPAASPLLLRAPRTGLPAWGIYPRDQGDALDRAALAKRRFTQDRLGRKFLDFEDYVWPRNLNPEDPEASAKTLFPFENDNHRVAIVHVDGNGFGQALTDVRSKAQQQRGADWVAVEYDFSRRVDEMGIKAVQEATLEILAPMALPLPDLDLNVMPARPLVLGGDDLTLILRADVALDFVADFIRRFERVSQGMIETFSADHNITLAGNRMTACAGIAFVGAKRPFDRAYRLAEALCLEAKQAAAKARMAQGDGEGLTPSFLAFGDSTVSLSSVEDLLVRSPGGAQLAGVAYHLGEVPAPAFPSFQGLQALKTFFAQNQGLARGALNDILSQQRLDEDEADRRWQRWLKVMDRRGAKGQELVTEIKKHLRAVTPNPNRNSDVDQSPMLADPREGGRFCPLGDVLSWLKAEARFNDAT